MAPPTNKTQEIRWFPIIKKDATKKESIPSDLRLSDRRLLAGWRNFSLWSDSAFSLVLQRRSRRLSAKAVLG
jgi:hypothetical protein